MDLDHDRLDVYHLALDFLVLASEIIEGLPCGRSHLSDRFSRASLSIVLNLAEGAGKHSKPDKRRYYLTARGSARESAALLDVCCRLKLLEESGHRTGKADDCSHCVDADQVGPERRGLSQSRSQNSAHPSRPPQRSLRESSRNG